MHEITSPAGIRLSIHADGSLCRAFLGDVMINLFPGNEAEGGPANLFLRMAGAGAAALPLLGPRGMAAFAMHPDGVSAAGCWHGIDFQVRLVLAAAAPAWFWHVELANQGTAPVTLDLIHTQDLGLAHEGAVRLNEYYVSQYIDHTPLVHPRAGVVIASRQNQAVGGRFPWAVTGSLGRAVSYATDALQFCGRAARLGQEPPGLVNGLPGKRLQHEHSLACLQDEPFVLEPGASIRKGFFLRLVADHPAATSADDLSWVDDTLALPEARLFDLRGNEGVLLPAQRTHFATAELWNGAVPGVEILQRFFGSAWRHEEREDGVLWSFFTPDGSHVVLRSKEEAVLRPHGHLLRTGASLVPDEAALTSTVWMGGVFHSMVTQGHVSINRFLSTCHGYLGLFRSHGQRIFMETDGSWVLLGTPSAFEMKAATCRWIYRRDGSLIEVTATAHGDRHELGLEIRVHQGGPRRFLISHHVAIHGDDGARPLPLCHEVRGAAAIVRPVPDSDVGRRFPDGSFVVKASAGTPLERIGDDGLLFTDGRSRGLPFLCVLTAPCDTAGLLIEGHLVEAGPADGGGLASLLETAPEIVEAPSACLLSAPATGLTAWFPWLVHNALVHFLSPRGLEQYSGGGWGTRDVSQGPLELWLALGRMEPVRDLLLRLFRQQNPDGDWPQWFMFFERERHIRPGDSHGDIVYWPLFALAQYLIASGDAAILDEQLPFFETSGEGETHSLLVHVHRALERIGQRVIPGTVLAAYGHGDWNDALQPADPAMRDQLCSSWTVTLCHQTLATLARALRHCGREAGLAESLESKVAAVREAFQRELVIDGVVAGLVHFHDDEFREVLLHPRDRRTGLSYSLLPMIHAILADLFTPEQAAAHLAIIRTHLTGPDGARLFDRPMAYHGGPQSMFQRIESASYFGREIGVMYTHAHLRYCEALARVGEADAFFDALRRINPVGLRALVPAAAPRQTNCYFSSSDAAFADRYEAFEHYDRALRGEVPLEGGWRVYSSGAGIATRLVLQCFLGLRVEDGAVVVDPVVPPALNGLRVRLAFHDQPLEVVYHTGPAGCGPLAVEVDGEPLAFTRDDNPYRPGAARFVAGALQSALQRAARPWLTIRLG